jgi:hypothetical protein
MNNPPEIEASIQEIQAIIPTLKSSEVIGFAYKDMGLDFKNGLIDISIWDDLMKLKFDDKISDLASTRGCYIDDEDYAIVFTGTSSEDNNFAYMKRPSVKRASLAFVTRLVLYYERRKLKDRKNLKRSDRAEVKIECLNGVELYRQVNEKAAELILAGKLDRILDFLEDR